MKRPVAAAIGAALCAMAAPALAARTPDAVAIDELLRSARLWQALERPDTERKVLGKLFSVQADEPRALFLLGELELRAGNLPAAHAALERLRRVRPGSRPARELAEMERLYTQEKARLGELRLLVRGGNRARALLVARALFPDGRPPGDLANEFAGVLASTPGGWENLRALFEERIAAEPNGNDRMALYELLAQHADTRPEALRGFADLARGHDVELARVERAWRRTLLAIADDREAAEEGRRFLGRFPKDAEVRAQVARSEAAVQAAHEVEDDPAVLDRKEAERLLDQGDLAAAEVPLARSLARHPDDGESVGTLGLLRLRQGRTAEALPLFEQAQKLEQDRPGRQSRWRDLAATARYWSTLQQARARRDAGDLDGAARLAESVRDLQPGQNEAVHVLAGVRAAQGRPHEAEHLYQELIDADAGDARAWRGLLASWMREGQAERALDQAAQLPEGARKAGLTPADVLDAGALRDAAAREAAVPHPDTTLRLLERGVALMPREPWLRYDLARTYQKLGQPALALQVVREGQAQAPERMDMRYAAALVASANGDDDGALADVEGIPAAERSAGMTELLQRLRLARLEREVRALVDTGHAPEALARVDQALAAQHVGSASELPLAPEAQADLLLLRARVQVALGNGAGARSDWEALDAALPAQESERRLAAARQMDGDRDFARTWMRNLLARHPDDGDVLREAARQERRDGHFAAALDLLQRALAVTTEDERRTRLQGEVAAIDARRQPQVDVGWMHTYRSAADGISTLRGDEIPVLAMLPDGYDGHWFGQVDSVRLDAGTLPAPVSASGEYGKVQALAPAGLAAPVVQKDAGLSIAGGWRGDDRRVDLGVVGLGFHASNIVGGWREATTWRDTDVSAEVSRRIVTGSLLSYAGAADPVTGAVWGGVTNTGVSVRAGRELAGGWSASTSLSVGMLAGRNVQSNSGIQSRNVLDRTWLRTPDTELSAGAVLSLWHYAHNDSFYTFGQGGYYSPQRYISLGVPVEVDGRHGALSYDVRAMVSHSWTNEADTPYYPTDGGLQALAGNPMHTAGTGGGLAGSLRAVAEYRASPHWSVGGYLDIDRSAYYAPTRAMVYLRYWFRPQDAPVTFPPRAPLPISQY